MNDDCSCHNTDSALREKIAALKKERDHFKAEAVSAWDGMRRAKNARDDYREGARVEARAGDEARAKCDTLSALLQDAKGVLELTTTRLQQACAIGAGGDKPDTRHLLDWRAACASGWSILSRLTPKPSEEAKPGYDPECQECDAFIDCEVPCGKHPAKPDEQWDSELGECTHGLIGNYFTCNGSKSGCERERFRHCCWHLRKEHDEKSTLGASTGSGEDGR